MGKVNIKSIAAALNLSPATVSRALNDSYEIKKETKERVLAYAAEHDYRPNPFAKHLKTGKTNLIGVVIPFLSSPFFLEFIDELYKAVLPQHYTLIPFQTQNCEKIEKEALDFLIRQHVAGIIISPAHENSNTELLKHIHHHTCPVILFDRIQHDLDTYKIGIHNSLETYNATEELIRKGRTKIALLCGKDIGNTKDRIRGYKNALHNYAIPFREEYVIHADYQDPAENIDNELKEVFNKLNDTDKMPNAIVGGTDTLSIKILGVLTNLNLTVPEDVAVIGFTNTNLANYLNPALSTIRQPTQEMAGLALELLLALIDKDHDRRDLTYKNFLLQATTTYRKSTDI
ncbi:LacI family DNA-binding transcriptional regulator [Sphingobacterium chuzhouense]|uniref:LacI family DNA-binding transcriptional regulator n=1 Tax=Sphingobacterium chuzhouense TaxID=1742264 RepID=A0ABR7XLE9_9SPHI|nr:LacI family DNA-binding transcriptional regulator [Sphingobacterium chuzhouense]MBD1419985.1 LacI family DNA-binding transcriptional regulator [Sphingobacterium chuzhouense]